MNAATAATVLVVDDHPLVRRGIAETLSEEDFNVVGQAASGTEGVRLAHGLRPDLIIMDLKMKGMDGIEAVRKLRQSGSSACVMVLSVSHAAEDVANAFLAGADGYVTKDAQPEDFIAQIRSALAGRGGNHEMMAKEAPDGAAEARPATALTGRERAVLAYLGAGFQNKVIARALAITEGTVKVHLRNMRKKLGFHSRLELALWARKRRDEAGG